MRINFKGEEVEAYNLIMKEENALDILSGKKTVEIREFKKTYIDMFLDAKKSIANEKLRSEGREDECTPFDEMINTDIEFVHFHNYANKWHLDALIDEIGVCTMCQEDIEGLAEDFDFHDYDKEWQKFEDLPDEEKPMFFYIHIKRVVGHSGLK